MKILIYGNAPHVATGYGVQIKHLATRLLREGHQVACVSTYGFQGGMRKIDTEYGPIVVYPNGIREHSLDSLLPDALNWFGGDPKGGWIITCTDQWVMNAVMPVEVDGHRLTVEDFNVLAWTPVDHLPVPPAVLQFCHKATRTVAMSKFGQQQMLEAGVPADYVPLAVDTKVFKPTKTITINGETVSPRQLLGIPESADFVVLMVAMSKDPQDRKNFNGAFRAFGRFWKDHQNAVLYVHSEAAGNYGSGINLHDLARHAAIPPHALKFSNQYAYRLGFSDEMMAAMYSAADVLLAPSLGEGFCVPMIEAQTCGTPVIASDFSAQSELVGVGWKCAGELQYDGPQGASYMRPFTYQILSALNDAYDLKAGTNTDAVAFASQYDADRVFDEFWKPLLASLDGAEPVADKPPLVEIDVIVPYLRDTNRIRFTKSLERSGHTGKLIVCEDDPAGPTYTYAENVNRGLAQSDADWVLVVGDDCEFVPGWVDEVRKLSDRYDVIGTNDAFHGEVRNPKVAAGTHADHFAVRRAYIDDEGASLDGPGLLCPECYSHWYTDVEVIELAKARGVYGHAHEARIIHHHPGYAGDEAAREADPVYMKAVDGSDADRKTWMRRAPVVAGYRSR